VFFVIGEIRTENFKVEASTFNQENSRETCSVF